MRNLMMATLSALLLIGCDASPPLSTDRSNDPDLEALYLDRFNSLQDRTGASGLSSYDPLKALGGANDWTPLDLRPAEKRRVAADSMNAARDYAERNNSSAFIVWHDGSLEAEHYFGGLDRDSLIVSKSLAKPLGVIAVGRALANGAINSLDQSLSDFFPSWKGTEKEKILVRHILDMRSGLLPQGPAPTADNVLNRAYLHPAHDDVIINEYPIVNEPGARYDYANANSELVAPLIERAAGIQYEYWLTDQVLAPIGARGGDIWMNRDDGTPHSGCCILLPAETYLRLAILLIDDGVWGGDRLLPEGFVEEMTTATPQNPHAGMGVYVGSPYVERRGAANPDMPYGQTLHSEPYLADDLFLFDGNSNQVVYVIPSQRLIILRTGGRPPIEPEWDNARLPNIILTGLRK